MDKPLMSLTSKNVLFRFSYCSQEPSENAAVERSSGLFDANFLLFQNSIYTCIGLLLFLSVVALSGTMTI